MTPLAAPTTDTATHAAWALGPPLVYLIDDDAAVREGLGMLLRSRRLLSEAYDSAQAFEAMLADIIKRDERDAGRGAAPMVQAEDAVLLDTTDMDIEAAFDAARRIVEAARAKHGL